VFIKVTAFLRLGPSQVNAPAHPFAKNIHRMFS